MMDEKSKDKSHLLISFNFNDDNDHEKKPERNLPASNRAMLKYCSLTFLTLQNCTLNLLMRMSRTQKDLYITSTAVLISEVIKLITCILMVIFQEGNKQTI